MFRIKDNLSCTQHFLTLNKTHDYKNFLLFSKTSSVMVRFTFTKPNKLHDIESSLLSENSHLSKQKIEQDLTMVFRGCLQEVRINWENWKSVALKTKSLQMFHFSKEMLVWQLVNDDLFTQKEADYTAEQVHFWLKWNAVKEVTMQQSKTSEIIDEKHLSENIVITKIVGYNRTCQNRLNQR